MRAREDHLGLNSARLLERSQQGCFKALTLKIKVIAYLVYLGTVVQKQGVELGVF